MTEKPIDPRYQLRKISDLFIDDLLATSDADILAEAAKDVSVKNAGERAKAAYQRALQTSGQNRLQAARRAMELEREGAETGLALRDMDAKKARKILERFAANDPDFGSKVTLAARNLQDIPDSEVLSIILDLKRLGALPDDGEL
jgi:hypothetical protein